MAWQVNGNYCETGPGGLGKRPPRLDAASEAVENYQDRSTARHLNVQLRPFQSAKGHSSQAMFSSPL